MSSSLTNEPEQVVEPSGSGSATRHAFLRPMPGEQRPASEAGEQEENTTNEREILGRLFAEKTGESSRRPDVSVVGLRLANFVIEELIGRGGMGAVFRAVDERLNRVVALKILSPVHSRDPAAVERFKNEAPRRRPP